MGLSLREVLDLPVLDRAKPVVLAGQRHLDNRVSWVHVTEQEDAASFLSGGELLLTTGMRLGDRQSQERFVSELAEVGVAGLVVRLGASFSQVPPAMAQHAEDLGLPLVALQHRIPFVDLMEEVHREVVAQQGQLLRRAATLRAEFHDLVLDGSSAQQIVEQLATMVDGTVVVEDAARRPLHASGVEVSPLDGAAWSRHSRSGHNRGRPALQLSVEETDPACAWVPLMFRDEPRGRLHVLKRHSTFDELDRMAVERAAATIVLAMTADREPTSRPSAGDLIADLVEHGTGGLSRFRRRARLLGVELEPDDVVHAWALRTDPTGQHVVSKAAAETRFRETLAADGRTLTGWREETLVAIVPTGAEEEARATALAGRLLAELGERYSVGISDSLPIASVQEVVLQAMEAATAAERAATRICHARDLGLDGLLIPYVEDPALAAYAEAELGPLLAHDASARQPLLPMLDAFLRANGRVAKAATEIGLDRRTVAARMELVADLLDVDLKSFETRLALGVAVRAVALMHATQCP